MGYNDVLQEALSEAALVDDIIFDNDGIEERYNLGITGTHLSGAVKRKYIDMKYEINKLMK